MKQDLVNISTIDFGNAYQLIRLFERNTLGCRSQIQIDVLVELYRSNPVPLNMKVLCLSAHSVESTLRSVVNSLVDKAYLDVLTLDDGRSKYFRLTRKALGLMQRYEALIVSTYGLFHHTPLQYRLESDNTPTA